jgi:integration host factor subunit alpha
MELKQGKIKHRPLIINDNLTTTYLGSHPMSLTKDDIVEAVVEQLGFPKKQSVELVETLIEIIKKTLVSGDHVLVSGFGTFRVVAKKERKGRNPATGEDLMLAPRRVVRFKESDNLRQKING